MTDSKTDITSPAKPGAETDEASSKAPAESQQPTELTDKQLERVEGGLSRPLNNAKFDLDLDAIWE